jgi:hypothetical protein
MPNIFDYIIWRGDLDFIRFPLNHVDNIIFSQLAFFPFDGVIPCLTSENQNSIKKISIGKVADYIKKWMPTFMYGRENSLTYRDDLALIKALGSSKRFKNCELCGYVNHIDPCREIQFSAYTIITGNETSFIAFRGTDTSLVGWKENFNMSFIEAVPAQLEAVEYLEKMAKILKGPLQLGGHSKGGNLAVYAAAFCNKEVKQRITDIYSNDAPGFHKKIINSEGFTAIRDKIHSFVPQSSVVGMLLEMGSDYHVIKSSENGLMQHNLYSWEVICDDMVRVCEISRNSRFVDKTVQEWIGNLDIVHREQFFEALYTILSASQAKTIHEIKGSWFKAAIRMINSLTNIDDSTRTLVRKTLRMLLRSGRRNFKVLLG